MSDKDIQPSEINAVIKLVRSMSENGDKQLSILAYAFAVGIKSLHVDEDGALDQIRSILDHDFETLELVPLNLVQ